MSSSERLQPSVAAATAKRPSRRHRDGLAWLAAALALCSAIAGCGFHLRGDVSYPFASVYVTAPTNASILLELKRAIEGSGSTRVAARPADAPVRLDIVNVNDDKQ